MSLRPSFRLSLPVVALALLVAFAAWPGARPQTAEATVNSISANTLLRGSGENITITVRGTADSGIMTVSTTGGGGNDTFNISSCASNGDCSAAATDNDSNVTLDTDHASVAALTYTLVVILNVNCTTVEAITVVADDPDAGSRSVRVFCVPDDNDPQVIVRKEADTGFDYDFNWQANGGNCVVNAEGAIRLDNDGGFELGHGDRAEFWCESSVILIVGEADGGFVRIRDCTESTEGVDDITGDSVTFDIGELEPGDTAVCTWVNRVLTPTPVAGPVTSVQVAAANIASCGGTTAVQVTLRNASGGPAPAGTTITATSSAGGTFQPSPTLTGNFPFSFATYLYQAPATFNGIATITVRTNNNVTGVVNIQVICTTAPAPQPTAGPLKPPSAGDGGLLGGGGSGGPGFSPYLPSTIAVAIAAIVMGGTLMARRREAEAVAVEASVTEPARAAQTRQDGPGGYAMLASLALTGLALFLRRRHR